MNQKLLYFVLFVFVWLGDGHAQNPPVNATQLRGRNISTTAPTNNQVYVWNASTGFWTPGTPSGGGPPAGSAYQFDYTVDGTTFGASPSVGYYQITPFSSVFSADRYAALGVSQTVTDTANTHWTFLEQTILNPTDGNLANQQGANYTTATAAMNAQDIGSIFGTSTQFYHQGSGTITTLYGNDAEIYNFAAGNLSHAYVFASTLENDGTGTIANGGGYITSINNDGGGAITNYYGFWAVQPNNTGMGSTMSWNVAFFAEAQESADAAYPITNSYSFWSDEQGVFRIKADNAFNSVYQAIPALYNPQFTKYTPGATNYERIVEQWESDVAVITTEKGGTGTLRGLRIGDASVPLFLGSVVSGAASGKRVLCIDDSTKQVFESSTGTDCSN